MTVLLYVLALTLLSHTVLAAPVECRHINARKDRNACYEQQRLARPAQQPSERTKMSTEIDRMKLENDRLNKRLQGICRGC
jgi:hypothetical protein